MSKSHDCPGFGLCTDHGCPAHYASEPISVGTTQSRSYLVNVYSTPGDGVNRQLEFYKESFGMPHFDGSYRVNLDLLPFEQWEQKHRWNGKGFTRPRGKKFKNAIDRYNNGSWVDGYWKSKPINHVRTPDISVIKPHGSFDHYDMSSIGIHDELDYFPDIPGEISGDELTKRCNDVMSRNSDDMTKSMFGVDATTSGRLMHKSVTYDDLVKAKIAIDNDPMVVELRNQLHAELAVSSTYSAGYDSRTGELKSLERVKSDRELFLIERIDTRISILYNGS